MVRVYPCGKAWHEGGKAGPFRHLETEMVGRCSDGRRQRLTAYDDGLFPKGKNTGAAVVVFPAWLLRPGDRSRRTDVCDWLTAKAITCVLLKYRVPNRDDGDGRRQIKPKAPMALEDAQRTVGWSAFTRRISYRSAQDRVLDSQQAHPGGRYQHALRQAFVSPVDCADKVSCLPDSQWPFIGTLIFLQVASCSQQDRWR